MDERRYERLRKELESGTVAIGFNDRALLRPGSPAFSWPDILIPSGLIGIFVILDFAYAPPTVAILGLGAAIAIFMVGVWRWVKRRARRRAWALALSGLSNWQALWECGAVSIWMARRSGVGCDSPDGNWQEFVRYQVDKARPSTGAAPAPSDFRKALAANEARNRDRDTAPPRAEADARAEDEAAAARRRRSG